MNTIEDWMKIRSLTEKCFSWGYEAPSVLCIDVMSLIFAATRTEDRNKAPSREIEMTS